MTCVHERERNRTPTARRRSAAAVRGRTARSPSNLCFSPEYPRSLTVHSSSLLICFLISTLFPFISYPYVPVPSPSRSRSLVDTMAADNAARARDLPSPVGDPPDSKWTHDDDTASNLAPPLEICSRASFTIFGRAARATPRSGCTANLGGPPVEGVRVPTPPSLPSPHPSFAVRSPPCPSRPPPSSRRFHR